MAILTLNSVDFAGKVHSCQSLSVLVQEWNGVRKCARLHSSVPLKCFRLIWFFRVHIEMFNSRGWIIVGTLCTNPRGRGDSTGATGGGWRDGGGFPFFLPQVDLRVSFSLIAAREFSATEIAGEGLLPRVRSNVRSQVVATAEVTHADAALKRLVPGVDADVSCQFVRARKPPVASLRRTRVWPLVDGRFAGSVWILPRPKDRSQGQVLRAVGRGQPRRSSIGATATWTS